MMSVAIASGKRPVPSRTRKLSPTAPMVLHPPGCGRVGHRRHLIRNSRCSWEHTPRSTGLLVFVQRGRAPRAIVPSDPDNLAPRMVGGLLLSTSRPVVHRLSNAVGSPCLVGGRLAFGRRSAGLEIAEERRQ